MQDSPTVRLLVHRPPVGHSDSPHRLTPSPPRPSRSNAMRSPATKPGAVGEGPGPGCPPAGLWPVAQALRPAPAGGRRRIPDSLSSDPSASPRRPPGPLDRTPSCRSVERAEQERGGWRTVDSRFHPPARNLREVTAALAGACPCLGLPAAPLRPSRPRSLAPPACPVSAGRPGPHGCGLQAWPSRTARSQLHWSTHPRAWPVRLG
jgi:hypothetical protein